MENIIKMLESFNTEYHSNKTDTICSIGGIISLLNLKIDSVEKSIFNDMIKVNQIGFLKTYKLGELILVQQVKLLKFCFITEKYTFQVGNDKSEERLIVEKYNYPVFYKFKEDLKYVFEPLK